jgi:hypothetical protein
MSHILKAVVNRDRGLDRALPRGSEQPQVSVEGAETRAVWVSLDQVWTGQLVELTAIVTLVYRRDLRLSEKTRRKNRPSSSSSCVPGTVTRPQAAVIYQRRGLRAVGEP